MPTPFCRYIVGAWFGNEAIGKADPGVIILAFFTFYLALSSWAAAFSTYFSTNIHGYGFGFFLAVIMWLFQGVISSLLYTSSVPSAVRTLISLLLPPFVWAKGFAAINNAAERGGFKWADLSDDGVQCPRYCSLLCPCEYSVEVGSRAQGHPAPGRVHPVVRHPVCLLGSPRSLL